MESPVRICLGAAIVVNLLLLGTNVRCKVLPQTFPVAANERSAKLNKTNKIWATDKPSTPNILSNELNPKESVSEEHTEKNAKYKDRGRIRYFTQIKSTTESHLRRIKPTTDSSNLIIVTPTPEMKKPVEIIDSMKMFKKTKMASVSSSTTPNSAEKEAHSIEEYDSENDEEDKGSFEKFTSSKFHEDSFMIPSFDDHKDNFNNKANKQDYSSPSYEFSNFYPKGKSFGYSELHNDDDFKSETFFDFNSELTTPKNDFFDKRYQQISGSIRKNLELRKVISPSPTHNITNLQKIVKENVGLETHTNTTPRNKSTVFIKNTKEIRMSDNEGAAGSANEALSDVHGTSIYYEMSVLSTETYAINHSDDYDCDNDTLTSDPTVSTSSDLELASIKAIKVTENQAATKTPFPNLNVENINNHLPSVNATEPTLIQLLTISRLPDSTMENISNDLSLKIKGSTVNQETTGSLFPDHTGKKISNSIPSEKASKATTIIYVPTRPPFPDPTVNIIDPSDSSILSSEIPYSSTDDSTMTSTEKLPKVYSNSFGRNRNYSKRLNFGVIKDSPNSVTNKPDDASYSSYTRKFYHTTPRNRPIWMAPKRNLTKVSFTRSTPPTTIYAEHFIMKNKITNTHKPNLLGKSTLTTVSSEIDPVVQSELGLSKKILNTQPISDNSILSLRKRGSTKYFTSTESSADVSHASEMEIPPTSIAWALATMKNPSPLQSPLNITNSTQKSINKNELQNVGVVLDKAIENTVSSSSATSSPASENTIQKFGEDNLNKIFWQPMVGQISEDHIKKANYTTETKSEKLGAESNILIKSTAETQTPELVKSKSKTFTPIWMPITSQVEQTTKADRIPPVNATRSTGFESITKFPSDVTTPTDETIASFESNITIGEKKPTTDYEITTIRFSYIPTEPTEFSEEDTSDTESTTRNNQHSIIPTRTKFSTLKETPVTTYRPKYITTTEISEESTITLDTTPTIIEVSSQILDKTTEEIIDTTKTIELMTETKTTATQVTTEESTEAITYTELTRMTTAEITEESIPTTTVYYTEPPPDTTTVEITAIAMTSTPIPTTTVTSTPQEETSTIIVEVVTEINTEKEKIISTTQEPVTDIETDNVITTDCLEENDNSNEVISQNLTSSTITTTTTENLLTTNKQTSAPIIEITTTEKVDYTTQKVLTEITTAEIHNEIIPDTKTEIPKIAPKMTTKTLEEISPTQEDTSTDCSTENDITTKSVNDLEDLTDYAGDVTTEASSRVLSEESGTGAAIAIAVSTIGVIALVLLIGLLLVVRRRGRRGVYAQRCTPVSLDAYSLDSVSVGHRKGNHRLRASKRSYGNPAYDDEVTSHPMQYPALANFALDIDSMTAEFAEIPSVTVRYEEVPPGCEDKNRYSNVLPLPETRVPLTRLDNDPTTEYINANYITGPGNIRNYYIACQAPLSNTVVDFWRMIWEQNSRLIVMLTEYMENGVEKCYEYLPPSEISDNKRIFGDFKIILKKREQRDKYAISSVQIINLATRTWREVTHLWYFWPAKGVPDDYDSIIDFLSEMRSYMKISQTAKEYDDEGVEVIYGDQNRSSYGNLAKLRSDDHSGNGVNVYSPAKAEEAMRRHATNGTLAKMKAASEIEGVRPCVVTCASGAGRSAVIIALDISARALAAGCADVPRAVRHLRAQRPHSLSNRHHYILLYKVLSEYGNKLMGGGVDTI